MQSTLILSIAKFVFFLGLLLPCQLMAKPEYGVALYGEPKYSEGFKSFDYVNPEAPKGGVLNEAAYSGFDTVNPFVINGVVAPGIGLTHDTLMKQSADEQFTLYGLIAETIDISDDRQTVAFKINPKACFSDGSSIKAEDVLFSFNILKEKGLPTYRAYYRDVLSVEVPQEDLIVFHLSPTTNRELPLILGDLPVLSKKWWSQKDFTKTSLDIPVSSGPYVIEKIVPNRTIVYKRNPYYWAMNLNVNKGANNFDTIKFDVYRDTTVAIEAFKAGFIDVRIENEAKKWHNFLKDTLVKEKKIIAKAFQHHMPSGMQGFVFNLRRPIFQDIHVRKAISDAFDFEWTNQSLFYNSYKRTGSYFENSFLKAPPQMSETEYALLDSLRSYVPESIFVRESGVSDKDMRSVMDNSLSLLKSAGWNIDRFGILRDQTGAPFTFEILIDSSSAPVWERVILPYINRLKRLGITASVKAIDSIQYKNRLDLYDYDMIVTVWGQSFSPGNEQRSFWGSLAADTEGSWNYSGIKNKAVDQLVEKIIAATDKEEYLTAVHALDRVLIHLNLVVPHWHIPEHRYLFWDKFGMPDIVPMKGMDIMNWWSKNF